MGLDCRHQLSWNYSGRWDTGCGTDASGYNDAPPQTPTGQNAVMQKRPPNPLTEDSDPVNSPDPQGAVPGQAKTVLGQA